ncbi:MAG TPA: sialidase family protein [Gaiellaceae bacterium]
MAFFVAGSVGAEIDFPKGMAGKRSVQGAGFDKQHGPFSQIECSVTATGPNTKLDCDDPFPNNEPQIGVNPVNPNHMIASSNDFGTCCDQFYTTFDGGAHWQTGNMSRENANKTGSDPVTVFDRKHGVALHSSLSYSTLHANGTQACDGDVVVSISRDGGLTWEIPVKVDDGIGCDLSKTQFFNDKEWITVDNNPASQFYGRAYLTWTKFESHDGAYASSAIFESQSDNGGATWTPAREISGSNSALCTFQVSGPAGQCDENQFSSPTVAPNGTVYVAFQNEQNQALWESAKEFDDQYLVVKSTNGGATWSSPSFVVGLEDGARDYPLNADGRQTLSGYQVRVNSVGNIVASPIDGKLYLVYSDNSAGTHDSATPVTNTNVYVMTSTDGTSWSGPFAVDTSASDQWFPWADVSPTTGKVGVIYNDRSATTPSVYNASLSEGQPGSFVKTVVSTAASHPTQSRFFQAGVPDCMTCAVFHGDYIALAYGSDGKANMAWTDMRDADPTAAGLFDQFIYFARK